MEKRNVLGSCHQQSILAEEFVLLRALTIIFIFSLFIGIFTCFLVCFIFPEVKIRGELYIFFRTTQMYTLRVDQYRPSHPDAIGWDTLG